MPPDLVGKSIKQGLKDGAARLKNHGFQSPMRDVRLLLAHAVGLEVDRLNLHADDILDSSSEAKFREFLDERISRTPVSRILGSRLFYGRKFNNSQYVLDPRPETETLIELALVYEFERVLDLGTGSGCIAVTLAAERPYAKVMASDISEHALQTAEVNADRLGVRDRTEFVVSDWFQSIEGQFDLIVSNPPYIHPKEMLDLAPEVAEHDPEIALTDNVDGLTAYRAISKAAYMHLVDGGRILVEIGPRQAKDVRDLFLMSGLENVEVHADLDGRDRVVSAIKANS